jgi:hypothetical protein
MRLQPFYVEDVGQAIAKMMQSGQTGPTMFERGGPRVSAARIKPILFPVPRCLGRIESYL